MGESRWPCAISKLNTVRLHGKVDTRLLTRALVAFDARIDAQVAVVIRALHDSWHNARPRQSVLYWNTECCAYLLLQELP
jgi:hypothetical protein